MKALITIAFLLTPAFASHDVAPTTTHEKAGRETTTFKGFKGRQFETCGLEQKNWESYEGIRLKPALIVSTKAGFAPSYHGSSESECAVLAVNENDEVLGKVLPRVAKNNLKYYSIVPGAMNGSKMGNFVMIPSLELNEQPMWAPANCEVQTSIPQLVLERPNSGEAFIHKFGQKKQEAPEVPTFDVE